MCEDVVVVVIIIVIAVAVLVAAVDVECCSPLSFCQIGANSRKIELTRFEQGN